MSKNTWWIIAGVAIVIIIALFVAMGPKDSTVNVDNSSGVSTTTEETSNIEVQ